MPKKTKFPKLRIAVRRGKSGQAWISYYYDMRGTGEKDIPLGSDEAAAKAAWARIHSGESADRGLIREAITRWIAEELPKYQVAKTRADYERHAGRMLRWCGAARWEQIGLPEMVRYARERKAPVQANRELAVLSIIWSKARIWGVTKLPWPAAGVKGWKNAEKARESGLDEQVFAAVYRHADPMLAAAMDVASATAMRITDLLTVEVPGDDNRLHLDASKTDKAGWFDVSKSAVLSRVVAARRDMETTCPLLIVTPSGRPVSQRMLRAAWKTACAKAIAEADDDLADRIRRSWVKDHRKLAADMAGSLKKAAELLQHSGEAVTRKHYRRVGDELTPAR